MTLVAHMNESRRTYEWVTSHIWMSHVAHMNESRRTYEWVTSHIWMSPVSKKRHFQSMIDLCHINEFFVLKWVRLHMWMSHVTHMNEPRLTSSTPASYYKPTLIHIWIACCPLIEQTISTAAVCLCPIQLFFPQICHQQCAVM